MRSFDSITDSLDKDLTKLWDTLTVMWRIDCRRLRMEVGKPAFCHMKGDGGDKDEEM